MSRCRIMQHVFNSIAMSMWHFIACYIYHNMRILSCITYPLPCGQPVNIQREGMVLFTIRGFNHLGIHVYCMSMRNCPFFTEYMNLFKFISMFCRCEWGLFKVLASAESCNRKDNEQLSIPFPIKNTNPREGQI
jgi:hypothetical protein